MNRRGEMIDVMMIALVLATIAIIASVVVGGVDYAFSRAEYLTGIAVGRFHSDASESSSTGFVSTGKGVAPVVIHNHTPESFRMLVRIGDDVRSMEVTPKAWVDVKDGERVSVTRWRGCLFGRIVLEHAQ